MNHKRREKDHAQRYWPWCRRDGLGSLHSSLSVSGSWIRGRQFGLYRRALPFRHWGEQKSIQAQPTQKAFPESKSLAIN